MIIKMISANTAFLLNLTEYFSPLASFVCCKSFLNDFKEVNLIRIKILELNCIEFYSCLQPVMLQWK